MISGHDVFAFGVIDRVCGAERPAPGRADAGCTSTAMMGSQPAIFAAIRPGEANRANAEHNRNCRRRAASSR